MAAVVGLLEWSPTEFYQWPNFVLLGIIYTGLVCSGELSKEGPLIFSKRNSRPFSVILGAHLAFLMILFALWRLAFFIDPYLPNWMTNYIGRSGTISNIVFVAAMVVLQFIERRWLYLDSENEQS